MEYSELSVKKNEIFMPFPALDTKVMNIKPGTFVSDFYFNFLMGR